MNKGRSLYQEDYQITYEPFVKTLWKRDVTNDEIQTNVSVKSIETKFNIDSGLCKGRGEG